MSRLWMMLRKTGPNPDDVIFTSHVEGLDELRRQFRINVILSAALVLIVVFLEGLLAGSNEQPVWAFIGGVLMTLVIAISCLLTGMSFGTYQALRHLGQADVRMTVMEEGEDDE